VTLIVKTPVVLLIFNRFDTTEQVFEVIRQARPEKLLIVADGPRDDRPGEKEQCAATRAVIEQVNWDCDILTNYSDINLGCGVRVSTGLDWVFNQVEEAIILEDDCLPHPHFFDFCECLLERYRDDDRIMHISGNNHLVDYNNRSTKYSYYFSRYPLIWGWATWRRAWQHYDFKMERFQEVINDGWLEQLLENRREVYIWTKKFQSVYKNSYTWDYQWLFTCWMQAGLSIHPTVNLVSNIGFGAGATHTYDGHNPWANLSTNPLTFPLSHPPFVIRDAYADHHLQNTQFDPNKLNRLRMKLRQLFNQRTL
jgi:hypothetical protein